ncbi:FtsX-like permease family protein [Candidatus Woesearchaeota archaeon]|nr:MAG: FtsX-like permease family protein [Candidatus Woesearchaeota archaeon]
MIKDFIKLAWGNISHRKIRSWLTMIGIFIGIAAVVSLIALGQGLEKAVITQFNIAGTDVLTIQAQGTGQGPPGAGVVNHLTQDQLDKIDDVLGVDVAIGRIIQTGKLEYNDQLGFGFAASMPDGEARKAVHEILNLKAEKGRLLRDDDRYSVVLGNDFLDKTDFGKEITVGSKVLINDKSFTVVGFLEKKGSFTVDSAVLMNEEPLIEISNIPEGEYDIIVARVKNTDDIPKIKEDIERVLRKERNVKLGEEDFTVETPEGALKNLKKTLFAVQLFVYIIASISIVVGGIGIMNTMYTAVLERTKEIGIMKSIGASNRSIFTIFFIESGVLGLVGGIIGVLLGMGIAELLAALGSAALGDGFITTQFSPLLLFGALAFSFIIGTLAGLLPAMQASKMSPVDALNYTK